MKLNKSLLKLLIVPLILFLPSFSQPRDSVLIAFKMKDQFDRSYTDSEFRDRIVIIIGSDREGS